MHDESIAAGDVRDVSVIIPSLDRSSVVDTVASVRAAVGPDVEVIVVDDGSTVPVATFGLRARVVRQSHRGVSAARNTGIRFSKGQFLYFLDDDDVLQPTALPILRGAARSKARPAIVYSRWRTVTRTGKVLRRPAVCDERSLARHLMMRSLAPLSACLFDRDAIESVRGFDESLDALEDWDLFARLYDAGATFRLVDAETAVYYDNPVGLSKNRGQALRCGEELLAKLFLRRGLNEASDAARLARTFLHLETARRAVAHGDFGLAEQLLGRTQEERPDGSAPSVARMVTSALAKIEHSLWTIPL